MFHVFLNVFVAIAYFQYKHIFPFCSEKLSMNSNIFIGENNNILYYNYIFYILYINKYIIFKIYNILYYIIIIIIKYNMASENKRSG